MRVETKGWVVLSALAAPRKLRRLATCAKVSRTLKSGERIFFSGSAEFESAESIFFFVLMVVALIN
jgi:hypothetical protein